MNTGHHLHYSLLEFDKISATTSYIDYSLRGKEFIIADNIYNINVKHINTYSPWLITSSLFICIKNRLHENNIIDRFDTRYCEHLSYFKTPLDCSKAIMIIQLPHLFSLYTPYTELSYITPIWSHFSHWLLVSYIFLPRNSISLQSFFEIRFLWSILLTMNAFQL